MSENNGLKDSASSPQKPPVKLNIKNILIVAVIVVVIALIFVFGINRWRIDFRLAGEESGLVLREAAAEAYEALLTIRDGQLCDVILDRAALTAIGEAGKRSKEKILRDYARLFVAVHDIRIAVRSAAAHKERAFLARAIAPSEALDEKRLIETAAIGTDAVIDYLSGTEYRGAAEALQKSATAFDLWCDDHLMEMIKPQKYNSVSSGPVVAYRLARENEIRMARIILTAKANGLPEEAIRERAREMYV